MGNVKRRSFIGLIAGPLAGATLDPEKLLWVPGAKCISIPRPLNRIEMIEFRMEVMRNKQHGKFFNPREWLNRHRPGREVYNVGGQEVFPIYGYSSGISTKAVAYVLPDNWRNLINQLPGGEFSMIADVIVPVLTYA